MPKEYQVKDVFNDNIDIHIILESGEVYTADLFTLANIKDLMSKKPYDYRCAEDINSWRFKTRKYQESCVATCRKRRCKMVFYKD